MQRRALVHIGYHKTATTWFQRQFYPHVRNRRYIDRERVREALLGADALMFDPASCRELLTGPEPVILCEEALCGHYQNGGLNGCMSKDVADRLGRVFEDADIVVFVRDQREMIARCYLEYVRRGGTHSCTRFLFPYREQRYASKWYKAPGFTFDHFDFLPLMRYYRRLFGEQRVHVFAYESFVEAPQEFIRRYCDRLALDVNREGLEFGWSNVSYRRNTLALARVLNRLSSANAIDRGFALPVLRKRWRQGVMELWNRSTLGGRPVDARSILGAETLALIESRFAASNRQLSQEFGLPLARHRYPGFEFAETGERAAGVEASASVRAHRHRHEAE